MIQGSRYKDRRALIEYDLNVNILNNYDLNVKDVIPIRKVFVLITDKGNKILKKINYEIEDLNFINAGMEYIRKNGFMKVINFEKTRYGKIYVNHNGDIYCVMDLIDGRESEYTNPIDVSIASKGLGQLHKACEGFNYKNKQRNVCGKLLNSFKRKFHEMELFKKLALVTEEKSEFDKIFLDNEKYYRDEMEKSIKILENMNFYKLCSEEDKKVLCHHDLAHHNILIKEDEAYFIDFDYSIIDLKVHDLCNFINKVEKFTGYDIESAKLVLNNYSLFNELSKEEVNALYGLLVFPQDFYSISKGYYTRSKGWDYVTFLSRMIKKNEFKEYRKEFLEKFKEFIV